VPRDVGTYCGCDILFEPISAFGWKTSVFVENY